MSGIGERIQLLLTASRSMNAVREFDQVVHTTREMALRFTGAERCFLIFRLDDGCFLITDGTHGWQTENEIDLSYSMVRKVLADVRAALWMNGGDGHEIEASESILALNLQTVMCAPLQCRLNLVMREDGAAGAPVAGTDVMTYQPVGALYVDTAGSITRFNGEDVRFFELFAGHAAAALENALIWDRLRREHDHLRRRVEAKYHYQNIIGESPPMQRVYELLELVKDTDVEVLITGETGTGKELIAKTLHFNGGRRGGIFSQVNCAALPEDLVEAELFGIERAVASGVSARKGRFEAAHQGTLFLDEIADMPLMVQIKILHFLQDHKFRRVGGREELSSDVRVIAATNKDLQAEMAAKHFREDLFYRLNTVVIALPPLRERGEDILLIAYDCLERIKSRYKLTVKGFTKTAECRLLENFWPGNVRELIHVIQRAAILARGSLIEEDGLFDAPEQPLEVPSGSFTEMRDSLESQIIARELAAEAGNIAAAARRLNVTRKTLYDKLRKHGLPDRP
ncbi:sigma-54-dependent Fis family transcriptional regulator [bacterium]|nr:sigma-54-dependent Fis family transcriptional regulator [candidate division CSSED10-310 bacterium]